MSARADLLPFYALCDVSGSMYSEGRIDTLNSVIAATCDAAAINPVLADRIRFGIITFSSEARISLPLCDLGLLSDVPTLKPQGLTAYGPGFELLRRTIESDVAQLVADGYRVFRPAAFFLTDGRPTDSRASWRAALSSLTAEDFPHRPNIVAFGLGEADASVLAEVGTVASFLAADAATGSTAIASFGTILVESVVASGAAGRFRLPDTALTGVVEVSEFEAELL